MPVPTFSKLVSDESYANRKDLEQIPVFYESDGNNPMFFNIQGLPDILSYGKHYFYISKFDDRHETYWLRNNSPVLFEFKSKNNVVLKSGTDNVNQRNGIVTSFVEVLEDPLRSRKEIEDGEGTLTIASVLTGVPQEWEHKINYRCTFPIFIRKNALNSTSPKAINTSHTLESAKGMFSFKKGHFTTPLNSDQGTGYGDDGDPNTTSNTYKGSDL